MISTLNPTHPTNHENIDKPRFSGDKKEIPQGIIMK
jgi:hypothetical protein